MLVDKMLQVGGVVEFAGYDIAMGAQPGKQALFSEVQLQDRQIQEVRPYM
jgi:hypothetical protein